MDAASRRTAKI